MGWHYDKYIDALGWFYPILNTSGTQLTRRWKAVPGGYPKYAWPDGKPDNVDYYYAPGVKGSMGGKLWYASGEPDVLTLMAASFDNAFCTLHTELKIPDSFIPLLEWLEITELWHAPDRDETGMKAALRLRDALADTSIKLKLFQLPGEPDSKADLNSVWIDCNFDVSAFKLATMEQMELTEPMLEILRPSHHPDITSDSSIPARFLHDIAKEIETRITGGLEVGRNGWTKNFRCVTGKHEDKHPSAAWHKNGAYNCFACGTMNAKQTGELLGLDIRDYYDDEPALKVVTLPEASVARAPQTKSVDQSPADRARAVLEGLPDRLPPSKLFHPANDLTDYLTFMETGKGMFGRPVRFPFENMRALGGFCETLMTGKIVLQVGASGSGKTILAETVADRFCEQGIHSILISNEWSRDELQARRLGRNMVNGTRFGYMDAVNLAAYGGKATAKTMTDAELTEQMLGKLPGTVDFYENKVYGRLMFMEDILDGMTTHIAQQRKAGTDVRVIIWDYIQQYPLRKYIAGSSNVEEQKLQLLRQFCIMNQLVGWSVTQVTKEASKRIRGLGGNRGGGYLHKTDMQYLREDAGSLILIWQPAYMTIQDKRKSCTPEEWNEVMKYNGHEGDDRWIFHNRMGEPALRGDAILYPAKNSVAKVSGFSNFGFDWPKMRVVER